MRDVLLVPSVRKTGGTGHLKRCLRLLDALGGRARILLPAASGAEHWGAPEVCRVFAPGLSPERIVSRPEDFGGDAVVFDRFRTDRREFRELSGGRASVGIDEGGSARGLFSYLIDTFPRLSLYQVPLHFPRLPSIPWLSLREPANVADQGLVAEGPALPLKPLPERLRKVLLTFGGEDPAGLTGVTLAALLRSGLFDPADIDIVAGPAFRKAPESPGGRVFRGLSDIRPLFAEYDAVFTSFGITPYEVEKAGGRPVLVNPDCYTNLLSDKAGFASLGTGRPNAEQLKRIVLDPAPLVTARSAGRSGGDGERPAPGLFELVAELAPAGPSGCPVCGKLSNPSVHRRRDGTFFRCRVCGVVYLERFSSAEIRYDRDYFFDDYRRQYGRTYLEDFDSIKEFSRGRVEILESLCGGAAGKELLDAGCAYGPFLAAARDAGFRPRGLDVSEDAVRHVRDGLGIPAEEGDFLSYSPGMVFDVLTLWYVVEHFNPLRAALEKAASIVKPGGFLALSTPNRRGVTGRFFPRRFYRESPRDHFTVWDSRSARKILSRYGFKVRKIRITGHHPERFAELMRRLLGMRGCRLMSGIFGLGDTFEIYAEKIHHG